MDIPRAFHGFGVNTDNKQKTYFLRDSYLMAMVASAVCWKDLGGKIDLVIDKKIHKHFIDLGFGCLYDEVIPLEMPKSIDPRFFWASGKMLAFDCYNEPIASIDPDLMVWKQLEYEDSDVVMFHEDDQNMKYYRDPEKHTRHFDESYNLKSQPFNAAFLLFNDMDFKRYSTKKWMSFMEKHKKYSDGISLKPSGETQVFLEQAGISCFANKQGKTIKTIFDNPGSGETIDNEFCWHIWGLKGLLKPKALKKEINKKIIKNMGAEIFKIMNILEVPCNPKKLENFILKIER
tara:strand:- start:5159 stop:6028 length:870 start_codon:yes stop_codon:yes gene_type:complete